MLMFAGKVHNLRHFSFRHLVRIDPALPDSVVVDVQHDSCGSLAILVEKALKDMNDEFHRRVVIVQQQYAVKVWPLGLGFGLGDNRSPRTALFALALAVIIGQARPNAGVLTSMPGLPVYFG
jgi:hypothetical protein